MKNLRKNLIITLIMVVAIALLFVNGVYASNFQLNAGSNTTGNATSLTNTEGTQNSTSNQTTNQTARNTTTLNTTATNVVKVNTVSDGEKDLPQTGENDVYVITAIGAVAIIIGGIAYINSKRYDLK